MAELIKDCGLINEKMYARDEAKKRYIVRNRKPVSLPMSPPAFLKTSLFGTKTKLALFGEPFKKRWDNRYEEYLSQFVKRRLGQEFLDYAINPFVAGVYAGDPDSLSVQHAFPKLYALEQKYVVSGKVPRWGKKKFTADVVIYAGRACDLASLRILEETPQTMNLFNDIYYPPVAVLGLGYKKSAITHPLDGFGMLIPKVEKCQILGTLFSNTLFTGRANDDTALLTVFVGGSRQPKEALKNTDEMVTIAHDNLSEILGIKGLPEFVHSKVWKKAIPQYTVGYGVHKKRLDNLEEKYHGLYFTGNYRSGISMADTVNHAFELSETIIKHCL